MKYTINGKDYSIHDINVACADIEVRLNALLDKEKSYNSRLVHVQEKVNFTRWYNPCTNPSGTWPIIEKAWDELMCLCIINDEYQNRRTYTMQKHNYTKLVAACICFIEVNQ